MTTLYLVRHAVTSMTGKRLTPPDVPLSDDGYAQADAVADYLAGVRFDAVYASPLTRAMETARPIARRHDLKIVTEKRFVDVEYGEWIGRSFRALTRTKLWGVLQRSPSAVRFPDGETLLDVQARGLDAIEDIREEWPRGTVCCVTHADVIRLVMAHYLGTHIDLYHRIVAGPASTSIVALRDGTPVVLGLNLPPGGSLEGGRKHE